MNFSLDITEIVIAVIGALATIASTYFIPLIKGKLGAQKWTQLLNIASTAAYAAEQLGFAGLIEDKATKALEIAKGALLKQGIKYDDETIKAAIEEAVFDLKNQLA